MKSIFRDLTTRLYSFPIFFQIFAKKNLDLFFKRADTFRQSVY